MEFNAANLSITQRLPSPDELLMQQQEPAKCNMKPAHKYVKLKSTSKDN
jgi:hypothetical protein